MTSETTTARIPITDDPTTVEPTVMDTTTTSITTSAPHETKTPSKTSTTKLITGSMKNQFTLLNILEFNIIIYVTWINIFVNKKIYLPSS